MHISWDLIQAYDFRRIFSGHYFEGLSLQRTFYTDANLIASFTINIPEVATTAYWQTGLWKNFRCKKQIVILNFHVCNSSKTVDVPISQFSSPLPLKLNYWLYITVLGI